MLLHYLSTIIEILYYICSHRYSNLKLHTSNHLTTCQKKKNSLYLKHIEIWGSKILIFCEKI